MVTLGRLADAITYCQGVPNQRPANIDLARVLGDLAVQLQSHLDAESTLHEIVESSVEIVPGARWAGISLVEGSQIESRAPTGPIVAALDQLQSDLNQGPCLRALREHHTVRIDDMATDERWPRFAEAARKRGVHSLLSFRMFVRGGTLGALNLYGGEAHAFDDDSISVGKVLTQHTSVALATVTAESQFRQAVGTRDVIGQAKGLLMQRNNITGQRAFRMLTKASQETNMKLVDIARWLVETHESRAQQDK